MGRPVINISLQQLDQAKTLAGYGLTNEQICNIIGISVPSLQNKPDLLSAIKMGQDVAAGQVHRTAYEIAVKDRNPAMCMFILKCRHGWKEKHEDGFGDAVRAALLARIPIERMTMLLESRNDEPKAIEGSELDVG